MSQLKVLSPFGPKIARLKFPQLLIKKINLEVNRITKQKKLIKKYDYSKNLVGQVKQEIQLPSIFIQKNIYKHISSSIKEYVKASTGKLTKKIKIINFWVVRQYAHEYNPVHYHDGHVSGVGYLELPRLLNKDKKKMKTNGSIDFINGSKMFLVNLWKIVLKTQLPAGIEMVVVILTMLIKAFIQFVQRLQINFCFGLKILATT